MIDAQRQALSKTFQPFCGMTGEEIRQKINAKILPTAKNFLSSLTTRILQREQFDWLDSINVKTIRTGSGGKPEEDVSFPAFEYSEIELETWASSRFRSVLEREFAFVIYVESTGKKPILNRVAFWTMPAEDLNHEVKRVWTLTVEAIKSRRFDDLPKKRDSRICHVRTHGRNGNDVLLTRDGSLQTRRSFYLNSSYLAKQL